MTENYIHLLGYSFGESGIQACLGGSSAQDLTAEAAIQAAINPLIEERTSILIAHRLSTILAADEILVVRDGEIVERGTHKDLVHAGGTYQELYETQFSKAVEA